MRWRRLTPVLALMFLLVGSTLSGYPAIDDEQENQSEPNRAESSVPDNRNEGVNPKRILTEGGSKTGVLEPLLVETIGYYSTGTISTITAPGFNETFGLPIDTDNNWKASLTEISLWNLERLYAINGTFDDGIPGFNQNPNGSVSYYPYGWDAYSNNTDPDSEQIQTAGYDTTTPSYIKLENQGKNDGPSGRKFDHFAGTWVNWIQTVSNTPLIQNFILNFDYIYTSGPLHRSGGVSLDGNCSLKIYVNNTEAWSQTLTTLDSRGTWYESGAINISLSTVGNFDFKIVLEIDKNFNDLNAENDYDNDGIDDGIANAAYITVNVDNVHLIGEIPPTPESVGLQFEANTNSTNIEGSSGIGNATIQSESYWTDSPVNITLSSNVSVSYDYESRLLNHRFTNSSWTTDNSKQGIAYSIEPNSSSNNELYFYLGSTSTYEDQEIFLYYPKDWDNATIYDPFLNDVTSQCTITSGEITIPTSLFSRLGWWEITIDSPNYAANATVQKYDSSLGQWENSSTFRSGNETRATIEIRHNTDQPILQHPVNVSLIMPNGTVWADDSTTNDIGYTVNTSSWTLDGLNTTAGQWFYDYIWSNGTEVAYGTTHLELYHASTLTPINSLIETDHGLVVTNFIQFVDADNGQYLMSDAATIKGNWSGSFVNFEPNLLRNWWEGSFDTSLASNGQFTVVVNASQPYYDSVSCQFVIESIYPTLFTLTNVGSDPVETEVFMDESIDLTYTFENGTGIVGADIQMSYSGPSGGLNQGTTNDHGDGNYTVTITTLQTGTYTVTLTGVKDYYETTQKSFTLLVGKIDTDLTSMNGTSDIQEVFQSYNLTVFYENSTGDGLGESTVQITSMSPSSGVSYGAFVDDTNGYYSIELTPMQAETYTFTIQANLSNHETQTTTFVLAVTQVQTSLTVNFSSVSMGLTDTLFVQASYVDVYSNGLESATISVIDQPAAISVDIQEGVNGNYSISIQSSLVGTYILRFSANRTNYETSYASFSLTVNPIGTNFQSVNGTSGIVEILDEYRLVVRYTNSTGYGLDGANIQITAVTPTTGLANTSFSYLYDGYYYILLTPENKNTFTIEIRAERLNHATRILTFTLSGSEIPTTLTANITSATLPVYDSIEVQVSFVDKYSNGIEGATISIINQPVNVSVTIQEVSDGNYTLTLSANLQGTYLIKVGANRSNYDDGITSFSLVFEPKASSLLRVNGTSGIMQVNQSYRLVIQYLNGTGSGLENATTTIVEISPSIGLSYGAFSEEAEGYYSIYLSPQNTETFTIVIRANITNHVTQTTTFTLTGSEIPTSFVFNITSATIAISDVLDVQASFEDFNGNGLDGATLNLVDSYSGLDIGITEVNDGNYTITVIANESGSYLITIAASVPNYQSQVKSFSVIVESIGTKIQILNGSSAMIQYGENYSVVIQYTNNTGYGLDDANITVLSINPEGGMSVDDAIPLGEGCFQVVLKPTLTATYSILFQANRTNHVTRTITFTLTVSDIPSILTVNTGSKTIALDQTYTLQLIFTDEDIMPLDSATIIVLDPPNSLEFSDVISLGSGKYNITITPSVIGAYTLAFRAVQSNYENATVGFSLIIIEIPTELSFMGESSASIRFKDSYEIVIQYIRTDLVENITEAQINFYTTDSEGLNITISELDGLYYVRITASSTGTWTLTVSASRNNYQSKSKQFILEVQNIETETIPNYDLGQVVYGRVYEIVAEYIFSNNESHIINANSIVLGDSIEWFEIVNSENGSYIIKLNPNALGRYQTTIRLEKEGFESQRFLIDYTVVQVPIDVEVLSSMSVMEGMDFEVRIRLFESDTGNPISEADVTCGISLNGNEPSNEIEMTEIEAGIYVATITMPIAYGEETYTLRIFVDKEYHTLEDTYFETNLIPRYNDSARLTAAVVGWSPIIALLIGGPLFLIVGYRIYDKRKRTRILRNQAVKRQFDDLHNLIGVLVLHRSSGLPVYSKFLRGGFDEAMISAFITAVTQFRLEVEQESEIPDDALIPVSDIIRVISTETLICAFITVRSPSMFHREKMIEFGETVGNQFDEIFRLTPAEVLDGDTQDRFDALFDEILDGALLKKYRLDDDKAIPRDMRCLELGADAMEKGELDLDELAKKMAMCGLEEGRVYYLIMEAIKKDLIKPVEGSADTY